uniref:Head tail connector protein n=1 Tax=Dulem virus 38 TaxID=3145756 RepID=A0AAU8B0A2_9CAUD
MNEIDRGYGPGDWPVSYSACEDLGEYLDEAGRPEQRHTFEAMATQLLWEWTNRRFGTDVVVIRPEAADVAKIPTYQSQGYMRGFVPFRLGGVLHDVVCGLCGPLCTHTAGTPAIRLPGNVHRVHKVTVNGQVLPEDSYRVINRAVLQLTGRTSQPGVEVPRVFPAVQDLSLPATEPGTWEIRYSQGVPVPEGGMVAAGVLALELAKAACMDRDCALPARLQSVTRQGVTVQVQDDYDEMQEGRTGIWLVDSWVASIRKPRQAARAYNPDDYARHHAAPSRRSGVVW